MEGKPEAESIQWDVDPDRVMVTRGKGVILLISVLLLASYAPLAANPLNKTDSSSTGSRATTTWSGTMTLTGDYTVAAGDTLIIDAGATISFDDNVRLYVEGELDVTGTASSLSSQGWQYEKASSQRWQVRVHPMSL